MYLFDHWFTYAVWLFMRIMYLSRLNDEWFIWTGQYHIYWPVSSFDICKCRHYAPANIVVREATDSLDGSGGYKYQLFPNSFSYVMISPKSIPIAYSKVLLNAGNGIRYSLAASGIVSNSLPFGTSFGNGAIYSLHWLKMRACNSGICAQLSIWLCHPCP